MTLAERITRTRRALRIPDCRQPHPTVPKAQCDRFRWHPGRHANTLGTEFTYDEIRDLHGATERPTDG